MQQGPLLVAGRLPACHFERVFERVAPPDDLTFTNYDQVCEALNEALNFLGDRPKA
jgi:hypothetical protein